MQKGDIGRGPPPNITQAQTSELPSSTGFEPEHNKIVFDGRYYHYKQYRYELLSDAVMYAQADASRPVSQQEPESYLPWIEVKQPTAAERQAMIDLAITFDGKDYRYGEYRYEYFGDAINYARRERPRQR